MTGLDLDPELLTWLALRRVAGGRVVCLAPGRYVDGGRPIPGYLAEALAGLTTTGLVEECDDPQHCTRMLTLTDTGATRYAELGQRQRAGLSAPPPEFPQTPAGHWSSAAPATPGDQPDPSTRTRWIRCPHDGRLHAVDRLDVEIAPLRGHTEALCGHRLPIDAGIEQGPSGALCLPCVVGVTSDAPDPGRFGGLAL
ncbi:MAG TPA: hypothetical protein VGJ13_18520 [Pseudonocardiaceae bacterium]